MTRVKRSVHARKKRRKVLDQASGYWGLKSKVYKRAKEQVQHSLQYAYRDRRVRKRDFRRLWIVRINAAARMHGLSYSQLIARPEARRGRRVDRKVLADLAVHEPEDVRGARRARQGGAARSDRATPRMRLHDHPRSSNAQKVRFLLGVLGLEYERRTVPFERATARLAPRGQPARRHSGADRRRPGAGGVECDPALPGGTRGPQRPAARRPRASARPSTGCWMPSRRRCARPAARSTRRPTAGVRAAASAPSRRSPPTLPAAIAGVAPTARGASRR